MKYLDAGAVFSEDGRYRYILWREWRGTHDPEHWKWLGGVDGAGHPLGEPKPVLFIMFNPSTANAKEDDPTIRRCVAFAASWKFERLEVVNLFAYRATDPKSLLALGDADEPVGPRNMEHVRDAAERAGLIVCAWGANGGHLGQDETALGWIGKRPAFALGFTSKGFPRHPLYVKGSAVLQPIPGRS